MTSSAWRSNWPAANGWSNTTPRTRKAKASRARQAGGGGEEPPRRRGWPTNNQGRRGGLLLCLLLLAAFLFSLCPKMHRRRGHFPILGRLNITADRLAHYAVFQGGWLVRLGDLGVGGDLVDRLTHLDGL